MGIRFGHVYLINEDVNSMRYVSCTVSLILTNIRLLPLLAQLSTTSKVCYSKGNDCTDPKNSESLISREHKHRSYSTGMEWRSRGKDNEDLINQLKIMV